MRPALIAALIVLLSGCSAGGSDTRTFALTHIDPDQAMQLVEPYVPGGQENITGTRSPASLTITAPESRLQQIEDVLRTYDQPTPDVQLRFQVIEADGFTETDPAIADVQQALQQVFRFNGYRLGGEAVVRVRAPSNLRQQILVGDQPFMLAGYAHRVVRSAAGSAAEVTVELSGPAGDLLQTAVTIPDGQVVVVGSARSQAAGRTLILVVRAQIGAGAAGASGS